MDTIKLIDEYINEADWRIRENANMRFSYPGLVGYVANHAMAEYALTKVYSPDVAAAHNEKRLHLHDLSGLCNYCIGLGLEELLHYGLYDTDGPAEHFDSALGHMMNLIFLLAQQTAGATALNDVDAILAPYIKNDGKTYQEVKQELQKFVYSINVEGRIGFQAPFVNFQLSPTIPGRLKGKRPIIAGVEMDFTYEDCKTQIEWIDKALLEILMEAKRVLPFPVINIGIDENFNWDGKLAELIFTSIGKTGQPTINNYYSSDYDADSVRSMCCSLRLDMSKIIKSAGQFGSFDNSGSLGVVTLNLPLYGHWANQDVSPLLPPKFRAVTVYNRLLEYTDHHLDLAFKALVQKRDFLEKVMMPKKMYPTLQRFLSDFRNFFNTVGVIGMNEMLINMGLPGIETEEGKAFCMEILEHINRRLSDFQVANKDYYGPNQGLIANLELVPGEGVTHRFAKHIQEKFPDAPSASKSYLTRGCWLPADQEFTLMFAANHQDDLQNIFSGGANFQWYMGEPINDWRAVRSVFKKLVTKTKLPFISASPAIEVCPVCGRTQTTDGYCDHDLTESQLAALKDRGVEVIV